MIFWALFLVGCTRAPCIDARVFCNDFPSPLVTGFTFVRLGHVAQWRIRSLAAKLMPYSCIRYHHFRGPLGMLRHPFLFGLLLYNRKKSNFLIMESNSETNGKLLFVLTKQICPILGVAILYRIAL